MTSVLHFQNSQCVGAERGRDQTATESVVKDGWQESRQQTPQKNSSELLEHLASLSDAERNILNDVRKVMAESKYRAVRNVQFRLQGSELTLVGSVPNFYCKQLAQEIARSVPGVTRIQNRLEVE